jgi:hypothetical protein
MVISYSSPAQTFPSELWHEGRLVLVEGDTLKGLIKYDLTQDVIQYTVQQEKGIAFSARKVMFFEIFDTSVRQYRKFFTLPYTSPTGYKAPVFFELLEEGKLTLLAREFLETKSYNSPYYYGSYTRYAPYTRVILSHKYFFLNEDGAIEEFAGSRGDLLDMMGKKADEVEKYIKSNKLKVEEKHDFAQIVGYYNSLYGS